MRTEAASETNKGEALTCFVIMPISDVEPYQPGHFRRVYDHLISPACRQAGFKPVLASDVKETNMIVLDVMARLYNADMVLCDLSSRNPNVLYELGFRQAFNRPVTLIKDTITERIFDIAGLRDIPYDDTLRVDTAQAAIKEIAERLRATFDGFKAGDGGVNSLVQLLNVEPAVVPERAQLSQETQVVLNAIRDLGDRVGGLETSSPVRRSSGSKLANSWYEVVADVQGTDGTIDPFLILSIPGVTAYSHEPYAGAPDRSSFRLRLNNTVNLNEIREPLTAALAGVGAELISIRRG
jgi:hypothetical protein